MRASVAAIALFLVAAAAILGQTAAPPRFEVASVKVLPDMPFNFGNSRSGGRIRHSTTLMGLVLYAYHLQAYQVSGMPKGPISWYAVDAETDPSATEDQIRLMFQTLLADRFKIAIHHETRELDGYALQTARNGPKIKPVNPDDKDTAPLPEWFKPKGDSFAKLIDGRIMATMEGRGITAVTGRRVSMAQLTDTLEQQLRTFVLDRTGLTGNYYFAFKCLQIDTTEDADAPTLFQALQSELGLRLDKQKGPVRMLIVDHLETVPTEN
jgi:uncharacterized protein (TIGR03435 family)